MSQPNGKEILMLRAPAVAALLLVACAAPQGTYVREGSSADDLRRDGAQCRAQAQAANVPITSELSILHACMEGKGWRAARA